ncbi:MAG: recombinase family protein [Chloroflexota bacterium]|nr:recombinase family protein [Chloroflexota bacterium]
MDKGAVKTVAYLRVSTPQQDLRSQRLAILEYARAHDFRVDDFIEATASGQASEKCRRLHELTSILKPGDRLVVSEFSRLGRSLGQVVTILDALAKGGVALVALKENIRVEGKQDIQTKVMTTLFALFAEVERDLISERTREGLARARASGRKLGRPKGSLGVSRLDGREDDIRRFLKLGVSKTAIAKLTGVSRTALYNFMSTRGLGPRRLGR